MWRCRHATEAAPTPRSRSAAARVTRTRFPTVSLSRGDARVMTAKSKRAAEPRRANKPLMEKRRRARINQSLAALKALILDSSKQDNAKHSKLEKADILELTVRHFQRHRNLDTPGVHQYRAGYSDCVKEVQRYLDTPDVHTMTMMDTGVKQRLIRHLDNCVSEIDTDLRPSPSTTEDRLQTPPDSSTAEEANNEQIVRYEPDAPKKLLRRCDAGGAGGFVFVLPSHYLQFASALGINLRPQPDEERRRLDDEEEVVEEEEEEHEEKGGEEERDENVAEKPLDFSKNNEAHDMWRPW